MNEAARGAAAISAGDGLTAVSAYTKALIEHPTSPDYFVQRSTAFTRLKPPLGPRYDLALKDAEYAVLLGQKRARREKIQAGQQRRVVALFGLGQYGNASYILSTMAKWRSGQKPTESEGGGAPNVDTKETAGRKDKMEGDIWKAKVDQKLADLPEDDEKGLVTVKEYPDFALPNEANIKKLMQGQLKADGSFHFGDEQAGLPDAKAAEVIAETNGTSIGTEASHVSKTPAAQSATPAATPSTTATTLSKIRHDFMQSAQNVNVTIFAKGVSKDSVDVDFQADSVFVSFPHPQNKESTFTFTLDPLFAAIEPSASSFSVKSTNVEIILRKKLPDQKWPSLEGTTPLKDEEYNKSAATAAIMSTLQQLQPSPTKTQTQTTPAYPTSSRSGPKNWDKLAIDLTAKKKSKGKKKEKKDKTASGDEDMDGDDAYDSDFGGDAVDGFFKKLYAGADDDTKKAMMKSFQESNGTSLSTNWNEVGKGKVEEVKSRDDD